MQHFYNSIEDKVPIVILNGFLFYLHTYLSVWWCPLKNGGLHIVWGGKLFFIWLFAVAFFLIAVIEFIIGLGDWLLNVDKLALPRFFLDGLGEGSQWINNSLWIGCLVSFPLNRPIKKQVRISQDQIHLNSTFNVISWMHCQNL